MKTTRILNIDILSLTQQDLLGQLNKGVLVTPNVDHLVKLQSDKEFYEVYQQAEWVVCDSKILYLLSKLLKHTLPEASNPPNRASLMATFVCQSAPN